MTIFAKRLVSTTLLLLAIAMGTPHGQTREEAVLWTSIQNSANAEDYRAYLDAYPNGAFAPLAKRRLGNLLEAKARRDTTIKKLLGTWGYTNKGKVNNEKFDRIDIATLVIRNVAGRLTGELAGTQSVTDARRRLIQGVEWELQLEISAAEDGTISAKPLSVRRRQHDNTLHTFRDAGLKNFEFADDGLFLDLELDPNARRGAWWWPFSRFDKMKLPAGSK